MTDTMTDPHGLPYAGALDAVKRIESALGERDAARLALDSELDAAHAAAERLPPQTRGPYARYVLTSN